MTAIEKETARARRAFCLLSEGMRRTVQDVARARGCEPWEAIADHWRGIDILPTRPACYADNGDAPFCEGAQCPDWGDCHGDKLRGHSDTRR